MSDYHIGLISGTSVDAIDAVLCRFQGSGVQVIAHHKHAIEPGISSAVKNLSEQNGNILISLVELDHRLGQLFADSVLAVIAQAGLQNTAISAIGSHGQTVWHHAKPPYTSTLQIGDPNIIAERTGITTVADFRRRDMAAGGQGAPLVPPFHAYLWHTRIQSRVVLNVGGIANITRLAKDENAAVIGFDTGPGNILMDSWIRHCRNLPMDDAGQWAASGHVDATLLQQLLSDPYFALAPPKSTGREDFNLKWLFARVDLDDYRTEDVQATLCELTAISIAAAIDQHAADTEEVIVCGGGAYNLHLLERLQQHLPASAVKTSRDFSIDPDCIEALAFAWLARETLAKRPGNLPSVTGANRPVILGGIYQV